MNPYPSIVLGSVLLGLLVGVGIINRMQKNRRGEKMGCTIIFVIAVSVAISIISIPFLYIIPASFTPVFTGNKYETTIVDQSWHYGTSEDSDGNERTVKMFTPIVEIRLENGETVNRKLNYSSGAEAKIGKTITVYFNQEDDTILSLNAVTIIVKIICFTACLFLLTLLWFGANYALGLSRECPIMWMANFGLYGLIPMMILGFTLGLLSYLYETWFLGVNPEDHPEGIALLVVFFVGCMALVIWTYVKTMFGKKIGAWRRFKSIFPQILGS